MAAAVVVDRMAVGAAARDTTDRRASGARWAAHLHRKIAAAGDHKAAQIRPLSMQTHLSRSAMRRLAILPVLVLVLIAATVAAAQEAPPARVGRISFVSGQ